MKHTHKCRDEYIFTKYYIVYYNYPYHHYHQPRIHKDISYVVIILDRPRESKPVNNPVSFFLKCPKLFGVSNSKI